MAMDDDGDAGNLNICPVCTVKVIESDHAIECEGMCKKWHHTDCEGVTEEEYDQITLLGDKVKWYCGQCSTKINRLLSKVCDFEDFLALNSTVKTLISLTKGVTNDNLEIHKKLEEFSEQNGRLEEQLLEIKQSVGITRPNSSGNEDVNLPLKTDLLRNESHCNSNKACEYDISHMDINSVASGEVSESEVMNTNASEGHVSTNINSNWRVVNYKNKRSHRTKDNVSGHKHGVYSQVFRPSQLSRPTGNGAGTSSSKPRPNLTPVSTDNNDQGQKLRPTGPSFSNVLKNSMKNKVVYGTKQVSENMFLKPAKRLFWLFVSGLDPSVESEAIVSYLKSLNESDSYVCEKLETRYNTYSSFKVGVPFELGESLMHPNLWFEGCIVGKYRAPRNWTRNGDYRSKDNFLLNSSRSDRGT